MSLFRATGRSTRHPIAHIVDIIIIIIIIIPDDFRINIIIADTG
jgi:hypothetical protein